MGYETKLIIGKRSTPVPELKKHKNLRLEQDKQSAYRPLVIRNGKVVRTKKTATYFNVYATVDLCKCGYSSNISKIDKKNLDKDNYIYFYDGGMETNTDLYGEYMKPVPIKEVIEALRKDVFEDDYRRFKWALSLLESMESMESDSENIEVLFFGH
jgi:hypothetical protein